MGWGPHGWRYDGDSRAGKRQTRGTAEVPKDGDKEMVKEIINDMENVQKHVQGKQIVKEIYVPGKIF